MGWNHQLLIKNHCKGLYEPISKMESHKGFERCSNAIPEPRIRKWSFEFDTAFSEEVPPTLLRKGSRNNGFFPVWVRRGSSHLVSD